MYSYYNIYIYILRWVVQLSEMYCIVKIKHVVKFGDSILFTVYSPNILILNL